MVNPDQILKQYSSQNVTFGGQSKNIYQAGTQYFVELYMSGILSCKQFLQCVNTLGGRSPNDLSTYPIIPVVKNRILKLPVQAQRQNRIELLKQRLVHVREAQDPRYPANSAYQQFYNDTFMNGTFCSNSASTLYYLFR